MARTGVIVHGLREKASSGGIEPQAKSTETATICTTIFPMMQQVWLLQKGRSRFDAWVEVRSIEGGTLGSRMLSQGLGKELDPKEEDRDEVEGQERNRRGPFATILGARNAAKRMVSQHIASSLPCYLI